MNNEKRFYDLIEDIFLGKNIKGTGGYINLLSIKHQYYKDVLNTFKKEVDDNKIISKKFKEEFFDKLYNFFEKYFSEAGSIYFVKTPRSKNVYEQVYSNNEDVTLFFKTNMLYYVKSELILENLTINIPNGMKCSFDVSKAEIKNNEKKEITYTLSSIKNKTINISVEYSKKSSKTVIADIVKELKTKSIDIDEADLYKAFKTFERQSTIDFFINKNTKKFLNEQLNFYIHDILMKQENKFDEDRLLQLKTINEYISKLIEFVSQFEDELIKVWNKPKFVRNQHYIVSVDYLTRDLIEKIVEHKNFQLQLEHWKKYKFIDNTSNIDVESIMQNNCLTIDTKYFIDLELEILNLFKSIEDKQNGIIINSDNYQALNTLLNKYENSVDLIYIDPVYNTGSDGFLYADKFKNSCWLTMMRDRLELAKRMLSPTGLIFISIDDNEFAELKLLCDSIFGVNNFIANFIRKTSYGEKTAKPYINKHHEYCFCYSKDKNQIINNEIIQGENKTFKEYKNPDNDPNGDWKKDTYVIKIDSGRSGDARYPITNEYLNITHYPPVYFNEDDRRQWHYSKETFEEKLKKTDENGNPTPEVIFYKTKEEMGDSEYSFYIKKYKKDVKRYTNNVSTLFAANNDFVNALGTKDLNETLELDTAIKNMYPKPIEYIYKIIDYTLKEKKNAICLDFFAGTGTTGQAIIKYTKNNPDKNIKFILVEMNDYFERLLIPRIEKSLVKYQESKRFFKYYTLEQYIDSLESSQYKSTNAFDYSNGNIYGQYIFFNDNKLCDVVKTSKGMEIDLNLLYDDINIPETLSNIMGLPIKKITNDEVILCNKGVDKTIKYNFDVMTEAEKLEFIQIIKPLIWWGE